MNNFFIVEVFEIDFTIFAYRIATQEMSERSLRYASLYTENDNPFMELFATLTVWYKLCSTWCLVCLIETSFTYMITWLVVVDGFS